jgi:hypothetical protein
MGYVEIRENLETGRDPGKATRNPGEPGKTRMVGNYAGKVYAEMPCGTLNVSF